MLLRTDGATRDALDALFGSLSRLKRMLAMRWLARRVARGLIFAAVSAPASENDRARG